MQEKELSLNAFPETLMNPNFCVMSQDMPDEKQARSCWIYSLNVSFEFGCQSSLQGPEHWQPLYGVSECV